MEICAELKPLADDIREWAIANATKDYVVDTGKNTYCTACGTCHKSGDLTYDKDRWSVCPSCGKRVQHDEAKSPKAAYVAYFAVLETLHDWQVIRYYAIKMTWTRGGGQKPSDARSDAQVGATARRGNHAGCSFGTRLVLVADTIQPVY